LNNLFLFFKIFILILKNGYAQSSDSTIIIGQRPHQIYSFLLPNKDVRPWSNELFWPMFYKFQGEDDFGKVGFLGQNLKQPLRYSSGGEEFKKFKMWRGISLSSNIAGMALFSLWAIQAEKEFSGMASNAGFSSRTLPFLVGSLATVSFGIASRKKSNTHIYNSVRIYNNEQKQIQQSFLR
jgi:hypothetical protein